MLAALLLLLSSAQAASFPSYTLESLAGVTRTLPQDLGPQSIVAVAFSREQSPELESWEPALEASGLPFVAVLCMGEMSSTLKSTIALAMRAGLESHQEARTFLLTGTNELILSALQSRDIARLVVLRLSGITITHEVRGGWSPTSQAGLGL